MKSKAFSLMLAGLMMAVITGAAWAESEVQSGSSVPDKALSAKMIRFGKEAYERGKYLDAKEYFRRAVQADPSSTQAWLLYDQTVIFALAERTEKNSGLLLPGTSTRTEGGASSPSEGPPPPPAQTEAAPEKEEDTGFVIVDDEGC